MNRGSRSEGVGWDHGNDIPVHFCRRRYSQEIVLAPPTRSGPSYLQNNRSGSDSEWVRRNRGNEIPVHFSRPSSLRSSGYGELTPQPGRGPSEWQHNGHFLGISSRQASDARFGTLTEMGRFEEGAVLWPRTRSSIRQSITINSTDRETGHRIAPFPRDREDPTNLEQEKVLKMLNKVIYTTKPKNHLRRTNHYYQDGSNKDQDEDTKKCAVCLEDFEPRAEVMVTPCTHMFHEECIVPWLKSHGQCPVCRFVMSEEIKANAMALSSRNNTPVEDPGFDWHLESVVRALDEPSFGFMGPRSCTFLDEIL